MRTGKIARLPRPLQNELNQRLERNVPGPALAAWLNSEPEVQSVLRDYFDGDLINEQNISNWRAGGFAEWQQRQEFLKELRAFSADAADLESALAPMAGHAARLLSLQFALTMAAGESGSGLDLKRVAALKPLFDMTRAVATLRQLEQRDTRLRILGQKTLHRSRSASASEPAPVPQTPVPIPSPVASFASVPASTPSPVPAATTSPEPEPLSALPPAPGASRQNKKKNRKKQLSSSRPAASKPRPAPRPAVKTAITAPATNLPNQGKSSPPPAATPPPRTPAPPSAPSTSSAPPGIHTSRRHHPCSPHHHRRPLPQHDLPKLPAPHRSRARRHPRPTHQPATHPSPTKPSRQIKPLRSNVPVPCVNRHLPFPHRRPRHIKLPPPSQ